MNLPMIVVTAFCLIGIMLMMAHLAYLDGRDEADDEFRAS